MNIRRMQASDIASVFQLVGHRQAEQRSEWQFLVSHPWCYPVVVEIEGSVAAMALASQNGNVGWLGKVYVAPESRGKGLGKVLTQVLLDHLNGKGCRSVVLIATEMAQAMYESFGFHPTDSYHAFSGPPIPTPYHPRLRPMKADDWPALLALDRYATGEERPDLLKGVARQGWVITGEREPEIVAYYLPVPWGVGTAVALDPADGKVLLDLMRAQPDYGEGFLPALYGGNLAAMDHLRAGGCQAFIQLTRMVRGEPVGMKPEAVWGLICPALG